MTCVHHWVIETPAPGKAKLEGVCKFCGERRQFDGTFDRIVWREFV